VARNGVSLIDQLAAVSKRLELERAVVFPRPGGHSMTVVSNLFVDRGWIADSIGVPTEDLLTRFQQAVRQPLPWIEVTDAAAQQAADSSSAQSPAPATAQPQI
jgi:2,5-furandicarboxylate decarboxylase 1